MCMSVETVWEEYELQLNDDNYPMSGNNSKMNEMYFLSRVSNNPQAIGGYPDVSVLLIDGKIGYTYSSCPQTVETKFSFAFCMLGVLSIVSDDLATNIINTYPADFLASFAKALQQFGEVNRPNHDRVHFLRKYRIHLAKSKSTQLQHFQIGALRGKFIEV